MIQQPLFLENNTRYKIKYRGDIFDCWRLNDKFITDSYSELDDSKVTVIERLGIDSEVFE